MVLTHLQDALLEMAEDWGFDRDVLKGVVCSEKLLGTCGEVNDSNGAMYVTFAEFMRFLRGEDPVRAVCHAIRHHRREVKKIFYRLADEATSIAEHKNTPDTNDPEHKRGNSSAGAARAIDLAGSLAEL